MGKKVSLINLSKNEIKKNQQKEVMAGQGGHGTAGKLYEYSGGSRAAEPSCSAWCECTCWVGDVESTMDNIGIDNAIGEFFVNPTDVIAV